MTILKSSFCTYQVLTTCKNRVKTNNDNIHVINASTDKETDGQALISRLLGKVSKQKRLQFSELMEQ